MSAPVLYSVTRAERAEQVAALRNEGLPTREIAERQGISRSYVRDLLLDPDGSKLAARVLSYQGVCEDCGARTFGGNGKAKAPKVCVGCLIVRNEAKQAKHGTRSRYSAGCSCDDCRRANRDASRARAARTGPPPAHGHSGYTNYGCRCQKCKDAHLVYMRAKGYEHQRAYAQRVWGTEPPEHGTMYAYGRFGCRCDACRAASAAYHRARRSAA